MRWWVLAFAGLWSHTASACMMMSPMPFHVPRDAVAGLSPASPNVPEVFVARGHDGLARGFSTSCDDIGAVTFAFSNAPPDGTVGYEFTLVAGLPPFRVDAYGPIATRDGRITFSWGDGASFDQEPFAFVVHVQTVSSTGARSTVVPVTVTHLGEGSLTKPAGASFPMPQTALGDCGIAEVEPVLPFEPVTLGCLEDVFILNESAERRKDASLALIVSAEARSDSQEWERLVRRHLQMVDGDDVHMSVNLAGHLATGTPDDAEEGIRLAERLYLRRGDFEPDLHTGLVYELYEIQAVGSTALWVHAQMTAYSTGSDADVQIAQRRAQELARRWYRFADLADQSADVPLQMCLDAGGSRHFCTGFLAHDIGNRPR